MAEAQTAARALPVLIAGGGIAGLASALALARLGRPSRILERREAFSQAGAGIQLGPNAVKALRVLGVLDALQPLAGVPQAIVVRDGASARVLQRLPLGDWIAARHGAPYLVAHRRDLQSVLLDRVRQEPLITVETGFEAVAFDELASAIQLRASDGREHPAGAIIAADGVHSAMRRALFPGKLPRFTGRTAIRTVIPSDALTNGTRAAISTDATGVWLAPNSHVVHYPVRGRREIAVVVIRTEDWRETRWSTSVERESVLQSTTAFSPQLREMLSIATDWRKWALFDAEPMPSWSRGRVVLIGDAAHPVLPFLAQGGGLALEDAVVLAHCIGKSPHKLDDAFRRFHAERASRSARVLHSSRRNGQIFHLGGVQAQARNIVMRVVSGSRVMAGYDWLYGFEPPALPSA